MIPRSSVIFLFFQFILLVISNFLTVNGEEISKDNQLLEEKQYFNNSIINSGIKNESSYKSENDNSEDSSWFLNVPLLPVVVATSNSIPEGSCKRQLLLYLNHLKNGTLWATEMFDSSAKYPYGIFDGHMRHLGSFDQCYRIQTKIPNYKKDGNFEEIHSRYCLVEIKFQEKDEPRNSTGKLDIWFDLHGSAWEAIREKGDFRRYQRYRIEMALCVPASCYPEDILTALKDPLKRFGTQYNLKIEASIQKGYCQAAHEAPKFSNSAIAYCLVILVLFCLVIISTIYDVESEEEVKQSLRKKIFLCFSARRSLKSIFRVTYRHRGLDCLHMLRLLFSWIALTGHRQLQNLHASNISGRYLEMTMLLPNAMTFHNASVGTDVFFGIGGLVLSYKLLEYFEKSKRFNIVYFIALRFMRLAPFYLFVILGYVTLFHHIGSGPYWEHRIGFDRDTCSTYWWANLLFINNYVGGKYMCMLQSWYLSVDFQCYIIGLFIIWVFWKLPRKIGFVFLGSFFIFSATIPFYFTYMYNAHPLLKFLGTQRRPEDYDYFADYYSKTHMRLPAYIIGIIVGALVYDHKFSSWRLSKTWSRFLFILLVVFLSLFIQHLGYKFLDPNEKPSLVVTALYASLYRPIFVFSMCSIVLLMTIGDGLDFHYNFLTPGWMQPISRLSFAIFLLHFGIQSYELGTTRSAVTFSIYHVFKDSIMDMFYAFLLSVLCVTLIEEPFKNLGNLLLNGRELTKSDMISEENSKKVD